MSESRCRYCGKRLKGAQTRRRRYCDHACKQAAFRARQKDTRRTDRLILERQRRWARVGYDDEIIERLMAIWNAYGPAALADAEKLILRYDIWMRNKQIIRENF